MSEKILSICIPTYNRANILDQTLSELVLEPSFKSGRIEICISDNASPDNTEAIVKKFTDKNRNITYSRNKINTEIIDGNFPIVAALASGEYIKFLNDYASFIPGELDKIIDFIEANKKEKPVLFFSNNNIKDSNEIIYCKTIDSFIQNRDNFILTIQGLFLNEMKNRNFHFVLSGRLWDKMLSFWEEQTKKKKQKPDEYFSIQTDDFDQYLSELSGDFFIDNKSEMIAILWGSVYIYDFLQSIDLINQSTYNSFKETSKILKGKAIATLMSDLWNSNFVHHWTKPDSISEIEFREEEKIFQKSIFFKNLKFKILRSEIADELKNIGELSEYIIQGGKTDNTSSNNEFDDVFGFVRDSKKSKKKNIIDQFIDGDYPKLEQTTIEKKIDRNAPCPCGSGKKYKKCCANK